MIRFFCRSCWLKIRVEDDCVGRKVKCPRCGDGNYVPAAAIRPVKKRRRSRAGRGRDQANGETGEPEDAGLGVGAGPDADAAPSLDVREPIANASAAAPRRNLENGPSLELKMPPLAQLGVPGGGGASAPPSEEAALAASEDSQAPSSEVREDLSRYARATASRRVARGAGDRVERKEPAIRRRIPAAVILGAVAAALLVGAGIWWFFLRDTWERDHHDQIAALAEEAKSLAAGKRFEAAIGKYEQILDLVGSREIRDAQLQAVVRGSRDALHTAQTELELQRVAAEADRKAQALYERRRKALLAAMSRARSAAAAGRLQAAVQTYQQAIDRVGKSPQAPEGLRTLLEQARQEQETARQKWQRATESKLSDLAAKAQLASDAGRLDEAERQCLAVIDLAEKGDMQTAKTRQIATLVRTLLTTVRGQKQIEERRQAALREKARKEAEAQRLRRANKVHALYKGFYTVAERIHREGIAAYTGLEKLRSLRTDLAVAHAQLPTSGGGAEMAAARKSGDAVLASLRSYVGSCEGLGGTDASASGPDTDPLAKAKKARLKLSRSKLKRDIEVFVGDYVEFVKASGRDVSFVPSALLQAGQAARKRRDRCAWCKGTGRMACPDCLVKGLPSGKAKCPKCDGKGSVPCAACGGAGSVICGKCRGKRRIWVGKRRVGRAQWRDVYQPCDRCNGTGYTHRVRGLPRPGRCPTCGTNIPKGTVPCRHCARTGRYGVCPTCKGAKKVACTHCDAGKTLPASQPAP